MKENIIDLIKEQIEQDVEDYLRLTEDGFWLEKKLVNHHDRHVKYNSIYFKPDFSYLHKEVRFPSFAESNKVLELNSNPNDDELDDEVWNESVDNYEKSANEFMNDESITNGFMTREYAGKYTNYVLMKFRESKNMFITRAGYMEYVMYEPVYSREGKIIRRKVISYGLTPIRDSFYSVDGDLNDYEPTLRVDNDFKESMVRITEELLTEANRQQLLAKSRLGKEYSKNNQHKGRNRFERRNKSSISATVRDYNMIQMDPLFKRDILEFKIPVMGETDVYVVDFRVDGLLDEIHKQVINNKGTLEFKVVLQSLMKILNLGNVYIGCNCLHPDTKIKLLDGTTPTVKEMCERFDAGESLWVYSTDGNGDFKPGQVERVWKTGEVTDFIKVTLDNGEEIITTPEHPYMLRDGTYAFACDLKEGQSLMPMYFNNMISEFQLNHKVVKVERIILESTPVYDIKVKEWENFVVDAGVVLHNCPDARYRMAYNQTKNGYKAGYKETRASMITNPNDDLGAGCKHVMLVLANLNWAYQISSVINNYIKYCREHLQRNYADYIFPKIYGMPYDKAVQMNLFDNGVLPSDQATMKDIIDYSRRGKDVHGRFVKNNPYRFDKKDLPSEDSEEEDNPLGLKFDNEQPEGPEKELKVEQ